MSPYQIPICDRSRQSVQQIEDAEVRRTLGSVRDETELVALFVMRELALGKDSKWAPYIQVIIISSVFVCVLHLLCDHIMCRKFV